MTEEQTKIEIENEDNDETETKEQPLKESSKSNRLTINRKKVSELTEAEKQQLIADAQNGFDNQYYTVKLFKNGKCKINLKKQTKAQQVIDEANEYHAPSEQQIKRYYTDNQLLMEHIINLETSFNSLRAKHKKLKKRYNELEGYLYNDNDDSSDACASSAELNENQQKPKQGPQPQIEQEESTSSQPVQYRYVRSWRDIQRQ